MDGQRESSLTPANIGVVKISFVDTGFVCLFIFDVYVPCPSQHFFSHVGTIFCLPGLNQY